MEPITRRSLLLLVSSALAIAACTRNLPTSPSAIVGDVPGTASMPLRFIVVPDAGPLAIAFPPRNEPVAFREALNTKYQGLGAGSSTSFVNAEGSVVWIQEYLRYRVNGCSHADAMTRVFRQLANPMDIAPVCGDQPPGTVNFPPRNESLAFRNELEVRYRDVLRASSSSSFVNIEGDIVWIQEYLRYRVNGCSHGEAQNKVFLQIDGNGVQPICTVTINAVITGPTAPFNSNTTQGFSGVLSASSAGRIVSFQWNCGQPGNTSCSASTATPQFRYNRVGPLGTRVNYTVTLTVMDERGNSDTSTYAITVIQAY